MEDETKKEIPTPTEPATQPDKHFVHTYADDVAKALDTTDATIVQELLIEGREREELEAEIKIRAKQKGWYTTGATILIICTLAAVAYTVYHYSRLTVPAQQAVTVGVFPSTSIVVADTTDVRTLITTLKADTTLALDKPALVPLVSNEQSLTLLTNQELFSFFEAQPSEPFLTSFSLFRLGIMDTGLENIPFVIAAVSDTDIAGKELLIAEPTLVQMFYKALGIDIATLPEEVGKTFSGEYLYNIPVRSLRIGESQNIAFFYARVSDNIVVFTTSPAVLKAIYNSLISQQQ